MLLCIHTRNTRYLPVASKTTLHHGQKEQLNSAKSKVGVSNCAKKCAPRWLRHVLDSLAQSAPLELQCPFNYAGKWEWKKSRGFASCLYKRWQPQSIFNHWKTSLLCASQQKQQEHIFMFLQAALTLAFKMAFTMAFATVPFTMALASIRPTPALRPDSASPFTMEPHWCIYAMITLVLL